MHSSTLFLKIKKTKRLWVQVDNRNYEDFLTFIQIHSSVYVSYLHNSTMFSLSSIELLKKRCIKKWAYDTKKKKV